LQRMTRARLILLSELARISRAAFMTLFKSP
jgi:hypothetical protein